MDNGDLKKKKRSWLWRGSFRASLFSGAVWVRGMDQKHFPFSPLSKPSHQSINLAALGTDERYFSDIILFFLAYNIEGKRAIGLKTQILKSWNTVCQTWGMNDLIQGHASTQWNDQPEASLSQPPCHLNRASPSERSGHTRHIHPDLGDRPWWSKAKGSIAPWSFRSIWLDTASVLTSLQMDMLYAFQFALRLLWG